MKPILSLLCALLAAGCQLIGTTDDTAADSLRLGTGTLSFPDTALVESTDRAVFERLHRRWEASGPDDYTFVYEPICFCLERGPFTVTVEDGMLARIEPDAPDYRRLTLDSLYARVADAYAQNAALVRFQYKPGQELLAGFYIDYNEQMADEEFGARVTQLVLSAP